MKRSPLLLALPLVCLLLPSQLLAQRGMRSVGFGVDIQVRYPDGSPGPAGIHIMLERAEGGVESDCQTIQGGKCTLIPASTGVFIVHLNAGGYAEATERVELVGSTHSYVTFTLRRLNGDPGVASAEEAPGSTVDLGDVNIPEKARQEFSKGEVALRSKDMLQAAKHFQKAVKIYDNYPQAHRMLGETYLEQQDWPKAEAALGKSIALEPKLAAAYIDLGAIYNQQRKYEQAEAALKKGLELSPDASGAKYELAKTYWTTNRWREAAPLVKDVVKELPELPGAHVLYGNILLKQRDAAGALHEYKEYLRLEPGGTMATQVREQVEKLQQALAK
jgi:tetratricopeptide (TPR) repeat protein